jgi:hypothetical protein
MKSSAPGGSRRAGEFFTPVPPRMLKLIAKYTEEGEHLGIANRSGIVGQAANNTSCITGRQPLDEAAINGMQGSRGSVCVDLGRRRLVLARTFDGLSVLHLLRRLHHLWNILLLDLVGSVRIFEKTGLGPLFQASTQRKVNPSDPRNKNNLSNRPIHEPSHRKPGRHP